jgi:hypothetical protein
MKRRRIVDPPTTDSCVHHRTTPQSATNYRCLSILKVRVKIVVEIHARGRVLFLSPFTASSTLVITTATSATTFSTAPATVPVPSTSHPAVGIGTTTITTLLVLRSAGSAIAIIMQEVARGASCTVSSISVVRLAAFPPATTTATPSFRIRIAHGNRKSGFAIAAYTGAAYCGGVIKAHAEGGATGRNVILLTEAALELE